MKILLLLILLVACTTPQKNFPNKEVCFLLYNLKTEKYEEVLNEKQCKEQLPAASTFKVPLSIMALDAKILKDEQTVLKWDGKKRMLDVWNKDQTTESWMKESVVWFSQVITPRLGQERMENYLQSFSYGNQDMSGGLKTAWLTPEPPLKNTLKISGYEQVKFLEKLWNGTLKASTHSQKVTKSILARETSPNGSLLAGKTGSGRIGPKMDLRIGWWIGYLTYKNDNYIVVVNFNDIEKTQDAHFGGPEARELAKKILTEKDLW